jgi:hypothetical protein
MPMEIHDDKIIMRAGKYRFLDEKRPWVDLTAKDVEALVEQARKVPTELSCLDYNERLLALANDRLKELNT